MRSPDADWWDAQAAEYVIGTLANDERRLFERMLLNDADLRALVVGWERRLQPIADTIPLATPSESATLRIRHAVLDAGIAGARASTSSRKVAKSSSATPTILQRPPDRTLGVSAEHEMLVRLRRWRIAFATSMALTGAMAAALAAVMLLPGLTQPPANPDATEVIVADRPPTDTVERVKVSLLSDADGTPRYLVQIDESDGSVRIVSLGAAPTPEGKSYELWVADGESGALRSVGLLPDEGWNARRVEGFSDEVRSPAFAVSIEPAGGSPLDAPTGEVVFQGSIHPVEIEPAASVTDDR